MGTQIHIIVLISSSREGRPLNHTYRQGLVTVEYSSIRKVIMDFNSGSALGGAGGSGVLSGAQKEALMEQVKQQVALQTFNGLLQKMTNKCFVKCDTKPGT